MNAVRVWVFIKSVSFDSWLISHTHFWNHPAINFVDQYVVTHLYPNPTMQNRIQSRLKTSFILGQLLDFFQSCRSVSDKFGFQELALF